MTSVILPNSTPTVVSTISASPSSTDTQGSTGGSASSSPLLFFVALGFGVLFTNLWIIVGVKYCFRYSQRNRRGQQFEEEVDLATLHPFVGIHHPVHRRRREKKLLKIDEVNERFPVMTYKAWRAQRERAGLSAEGGIAPQSGANTTAHLDNISTPPETPIDSASYLPPRSSSPLPHRTEPVDTTIETIPDPPTLERTSTEIQSEKAAVVNSVQPVYEINASSELRPAIATSSKHRDSSFSVDADDEDDNSPIPDELLATSGDNCAICIELLEDDDEVRGLTCGHCYHQTCLDPWLTQRRASCPLCKADYYIPKPASDPTTTTTTENGNTTTTTTTPSVTTEHWAPIFFRPFNRPIGSVSNEGPRYLPPFNRFDRRPTIPEEPTELTPTTMDTATMSANNQRESARRPLRRIQIRNPFRRTRYANTDASVLERGEGRQNGEQQNEGQSS